MKLAPLFFVFAGLFPHDILMQRRQTGQPLLLTRHRRRHRPQLIQHRTTILQRQHEGVRCEWDELLGCPGVFLPAFDNF